MSDDLFKFLKDVTRNNFDKKNTKKVYDTFSNFFSGYEKDIKDIFTKDCLIDNFSQTEIILNGISFTSFCEHHMLPFNGFVTIAYLPDKFIVGFDRLINLTEVMSSRLNLQERLNQNILDSLVEFLKPKAAYVKIEAKHQCICSRGYLKNESNVITKSVYNENYTW